MSTITLNIPEDLDKELSSLSVKREEFLLEALKEKIRSEKFAILEDLLIEGYKDRRTENKLLAKEFFHSDLENWDEY